MPSPIRLNKVLKELNISLDRAVEFLSSKKIEIEPRPTSKIDVIVEFSSSTIIELDEV